uniref:NAD(P)(+)--arginine ADP-ribosyltransferase n=1 Tax=Astyanax mexicanus TaxID=7994 RepID=A0A3B1KE18_ASTMX
MKFTVELILCLIICVVLSLFQIVLDDYPDSVDDPFDGCKDDMRKLIRSEYLEKELKAGDKFRSFKENWEKDTLNLQLKNVSDEELRNLTLRAYTGSFFNNMNPKMRTKRKDYETTFGLISLHFLITDGIQHLNPDNKCQTTYRFGKEKYVIDSNKMRFGSFTSSSHNPNLRQFGRETCFIIETCFGADISELSQYDEAEVLIPPYEEFNKVNLPEIPEVKGCGRINLFGLVPNHNLLSTLLLEFCSSSVFMSSK